LIACAPAALAASIAGTISSRVFARWIEGRTYRIGIIARDQSTWALLFEDLRANGFVEGKNLVIVGGLPIDADDAAVAELAKELVKAGVDAILTGGARGVCAHTAGAANRVAPPSNNTARRDRVGEHGSHEYLIAFAPEKEPRPTPKA
jgi:hypothetical protein